MPGGAEDGGLAPLAEPLLSSQNEEVEKLLAPDVRRTADERGPNPLQIERQGEVAVEVLGAEEPAVGDASSSADAGGCCSGSWELLTYDMAAAAAQALPIALLNLTHAYSFAQVRRSSVLRQWPRRTARCGIVGAHTLTAVYAHGRRARTLRQPAVCEHTGSSWVHQSP
jgi:hypothetical protein